MYSSVFASTTRTYENFAGVTTAVASKDIVVYGPPLWTGTINSLTRNPIYDIGTIGWTWWSCQEYCDGQYVYGETYPGYVEYGEHLVQQTAWLTMGDCDHDHVGLVAGKHDFKHNSSEWRPEFNYEELLE
jgi:hypothetical protein